VNRRVDELLGPFGTWQVCPHGPAGGCRCRKPAPGMITGAAACLGVGVADVVVIGDTAADVAAAHAAGARAILVPTARTLPAEREGVLCAGSLAEAVGAVLAGRPLQVGTAAGPGR
jgi:histidinol phosphatase-like enzyme